MVFVDRKQETVLVIGTCTLNSAHRFSISQCNELICPSPTPVCQPFVIVVKVDCKGRQNLQSVASLLQSVMKHFTVSDETYIGTHRTMPVTFITDCKSYASNCKSDMANYKLTITRGGGGEIEIKPSMPRVIENRNFWFCTSPTGGVKVGGGGDWKCFTGPPYLPCRSVSSGTCTTTHLAFRVMAITGLETILKHKKFRDEKLKLNEQDHKVRMYNLVYRYETVIDTGLV